MVPVDAVDLEPAALAHLVLGAQVEHRRQAERRAVVGAEAVEAVAAEQAAPAGGATVGGEVPAEVTEVEDEVVGDVGDSSGWLLAR